MLASDCPTFPTRLRRGLLVGLSCAVLTAATGSLPVPSAAGARPAKPPGAAGAPATALAPLTDTLHLPYLARLSDFETPRPRVWGMQFAVGAEELDAAALRAELARAREAGLGGIRMPLRWDQVEPENGSPEAFDWSESDRLLLAYAQAGFDVLVSVVGYPAWATEYGCGGRLLEGMEPEWRAFMRAAAARYAGPPFRIAAWEIGNEVDGTLIVNDDDRARPPGWGPGEPAPPYNGCWAGREAEYGRFLRAAYQEVKAVDPAIPVTLGGLAYVDSFAYGRDDFDIGFLDALLAAGAGPYFDFFNYHWFLDYPFQPPGPERHARAMATLRRHGYVKPVWITETTRLTDTAIPASEARQVRFLTQEIFEMLALPEIARVYWYGWVDYSPADPSQTSTQRGIVYHDGRAKAALRVLPETIRHSNGRAEDLSTEEAVIWRFTWPRSATAHLVAWSRDGRPRRTSLPIPFGQRATLRRFDLAALQAGRCCGERPLPAAGSALALDLDGEALFVEIGP